MKRIFGVLALAFLLKAPYVFAQEAKKPDPKRMDAIWSAAAERIDRQNDVWFDIGDFPRVIQTLRISTGLFPTDYDYATSLGWMLENVQRWDDALAVYISYRKANPQDPDGAFPEANFYYMKKIYAKVPPLLEPSIKAKPHPNSYRILAHSYEKLKMFAESKRVWEALIARTGDLTAKKNLERVEKKLKDGDANR